jgi:uncharacterized protein (DUF58 family)
MRQAADPALADVLAEVRRIDLQTRRLVSGAMAGAYLSVFRGAGVEFESVREYAVGDDPRSVDWNVTARMGRPYIKTFSDERDLSVLFVLDTSASMEGGYGPWSARQIAARICACLGIAAVRNGDRVGLVSFGSDVATYVPPRKGSRHALRLVRDCLALPATTGPSALAPALEFVSRSQRRHAIVFLLSDFLFSGAPAESWASSLQICARRHDVIAVRLLFPEQAALPGGLVRVRDPESGAVRVLDGSSARVRAAYQAHVASGRLQTTRALRRAQVDCLDVTLPTDRDPAGVVNPLLRFFRMREQRGRKR